MGPISSNSFQPKIQKAISDNDAEDAVMSLKHLIWQQDCCEIQGEDVRYLVQSLVGRSTNPRGGAAESSYYSKHISIYVFCMFFLTDRL